MLAPPTPTPPHPYPEFLNNDKKQYEKLDILIEKGCIFRHIFLFSIISSFVSKHDKVKLPFDLGPGLGGGTTGLGTLGLATLGLGLEVGEERLGPDALAGAIC